MNIQRSQSRVSKWGWGILLVISALLVLNGVALFFASARPSTVAQAEQSTSILLTGIGLISLMVAWEGFRNQTRWAWNTLWILATTLLVVGLKSVLLDGQSDIGGIYVVLAASTLVGLLLARMNNHST